MLYMLSTYASKKFLKSAFVLEVSGIVVEENIFSLNSKDITKAILDCVTRGLRACRYNLKHEDTLCICIQNNKIYNWLNSSIEDRDYASELEELYNTLDSLDCKYSYVLDKSSYAKTYLEFSKESSINGEGVESTFSNM